ncbi:hypothetical protein EV426DRAFT_700548 [Tirmania nivea]|nr:hypothetical protein EV426DRAFT_700548 [Tirmania nivea]
MAPWLSSATVDLPACHARTTPNISASITVAREPKYECGLDIMGTSEVLVGFEDLPGDCSISRSQKVPVATIGLAQQGSIPNIVVEVGFPQPWCDLIEDAKLYLTRTDGQVEMVIILEIIEQGRIKT